MTWLFLLHNWIKCSCADALCDLMPLMLLKAHLITDGMFSTNHRELNTHTSHYSETILQMFLLFPHVCKQSRHWFFCNRIMQCFFSTICTYTLYHTVKFQVPAYSFLWHTEIGANQWMLGTKKHIWKSETWWHSLKKRPAKM